VKKIYREILKEKLKDNPNYDLIRRLQQLLYENEKTKQSGSSKQEG